MLVVILVFFSGYVYGTNVFVNEIHYDNDGTDTGEFVEIAGPAGTDLTGWSVVLYRDVGTMYATITLSGTIDDEGGCSGALAFPEAGIQNGPADGLALVDNGGNVIELLSYEGTLTATDGPANGMTSTDIGVSEPSTTPIGESLQLKGTGSASSDFTWTAPSAESPGTINAGQTLNCCPPPAIPTLSQWGLIILTLNMIIFGIVGIKSRQGHLE